MADSSRVSEIDRLRAALDRANKLIGEAADEATSLRAALLEMREENERLMSVVDAARKWRDADGDSNYPGQVELLGELVAAVDALAKGGGR